MRRFKRRLRECTVSQFKTDSQVVAGRFKKYLDEQGIDYTTLITYTLADGLTEVVFQILCTRKSRIDLLEKFMDEEYKNEGLFNK